MYFNYYQYNPITVPSVGNLYGATSNGYPDEFGFRLGIGDTPELIGVSVRPLFCGAMTIRLPADLGLVLVL